MFCLHYNRQYLPADRNTLVAFNELLSRTCKSSHIRNVMVAVKHLHEATNHVFPEADYVIDGVLQGLKRQQQHTPRRVLPITVELLKKIRPLLNMDAGRDLALWTAMLTAIHGLFRK